MLRLAEDRSRDPYDPHKIYEFVSSGVLEVGLLTEGWDFQSPQHPFSTHHLSRQELGTILSWTPLQKPMADAVPPIPR